MNRLALHQAGVEIEKRWLMQDASLMLQPGQLTVLMGPNGAGKTTVLRLLGGLWQPTVGKVTLNGRELSRFQHREVAQQIAFVPQSTHINFPFTTKEIVKMGRHPYIGRWQRETVQDERCVEEAMKRTDVIHLAHRLVTQLSGGERQRVVIARSLATQANIILLDEPTANLDIAHALGLLQLLKELTQEGKTVALSTHDMSLAKRYADQVVLVHQGRIFASGTSATVLTEENIWKVFGVKWGEL